MAIPSWMHWYKKPSYVDIKQFASALEKRAVSPSRPSSSQSRRSSTDVPSKLSLERILKNQTCSPMSLHDFYMYLKHIEYSPENLEFYMWFKEYEAGRPASICASSQVETLDGQAASIGRSTTASSSTLYDKQLSSNTSATESQERIVDMEKGEPYIDIYPLSDPACHCSNPTQNHQPTSQSQSQSQSQTSRLQTFLTDKLFHHKTSNNSNNEPTSPTASEECSRREVINTIRDLYLIPGAPKELNIPSPMRNKVLAAIATSTSPTHLQPIADHCYLLLQSCSHRNFVRLGVSNGTFETVCIATSLGIVLSVVGFLCMFLLAFASPSIHHADRWKALAIWPVWSIGGGLILSGLRGSCFFLLLFSRRQPLPWEKVVADGDHHGENGGGGDGDAEEVVVLVKRRSKIVTFLSRLMIFDRKLKVKDDNLRLLQRKIVVQSLIGGILFATVLEIFFLALPIWKSL